MQIQISALKNQANSKNWLVFAAIFMLALVPRLLFVLYEPQLGGDSYVYITVARNIFYHGCVSLSDPASGICEPHWGGNQLPGYPAFIALTWALFGESELVPLVAQSVVVAIAIMGVCMVIASTGFGLRAAGVVAVVLALSPSLVAWPRMLLTETITIGMGLWVFGELLRSIQLGRLTNLRLGIAFAVGLFFRYDFVLFLVPIVVAALHIHAPVAALRRVTIVLIIAAMPVAGWAARCIYVGLPLTPPFGLTKSGEQLPQGILAWMGTWIVNQYELPSSVWPLVTGKYTDLHLPDRAVADVEERARIDMLLMQLKAVHGTSVPDAIDDKFREIANARRARDPLQQWLFLPLRRLVTIWSNPFASMGWPAELDARTRAQASDVLKNPSVENLFALLSEHPTTVVLKALVTAYRYFVLVMLAALCGVICFASFSAIRIAVVLAASFVVVRSIVFSATILVETRYLAMSLALIDVVVALGLWHAWCLMKVRYRMHGRTR